MTVQIPGFKAGTWNIDPAHSEVGFSVRHLMVSKVRGVFDKFEGTIETGDTPEDITINATIDAASINTKDENRDAHLRTGDFLLVEEHQNLTFESTGVRVNDGDFLIDGDLTMRGVTKPVTLDFEMGGFGQDASGNDVVGGTATTTINRNDFGVSFNAALESGGMLLGDKITITIEVEAVRQS